MGLGCTPWPRTVALSASWAAALVALMGQLARLPPLAMSPTSEWRPGHARQARHNSAHLPVKHDTGGVYPGHGRRLFQHNALFQRFPPAAQSISHARPSSEQISIQCIARKQRPTSSSQPAARERQAAETPAAAATSNKQQAACSNKQQAGSNSGSSSNNSSSSQNNKGWGCTPRPVAGLAR